MALAESYTLYYNRWSICSHMVRLTMAFKGQPKDGGSPMIVEEREVDIWKGEQVTEEYLTEINPKGQVPVLTHPIKLPKPMPDSLDITYYITTQYPNLIPEAMKDDLIELLNELHSINIFLLSYGNNPAAATPQLGAIEAKLSQPGISEKYREALEYKKMIVAIRNEKINGITPNEIERQKNNARTLLEKIVKIYYPSNGPWLWGRTSPTVLDVHVAVLLGRLHDVGLDFVIPKDLIPFYEAVIGTREWQEVFQGRKTLREE